MVVDTSALCALLFNEPSREVFLNTLASAEEKVISSVTVLELKTVVMARFGVQESGVVDDLLASLEIHEVSFNPAQGRLAAESMARFGKGRHAAGLNFGDCAGYALARFRNDELLFQGDDFTKTDIWAASSMH